MSPLPLDWRIPAAAVGAVLVLAAIAYLKERLARSKAEARAATLEGELKALRSRPEKHEFRVERFELVWFPTITASAQDQVISAVAPGVPHCRACMLPLVLEHQQWRCRQCAAQHPESLGDVQVTDAITNQALQWFQQRHPGYRVAR